MGGVSSKEIRDTIVRMAGEGYSHTEIAKKTGVSHPTVRKYAGHARPVTPAKSPAEQQAEINDLLQRVEKLEDTEATLMPLVNAPKTCPQGHELVFLIKCHHRDCRLEGEWSIPLKGSEPRGPRPLGYTLDIQQAAMRRVRHLDQQSE